MKRAIWIVAGLALAAFLSPLDRPAGTAAVAATPTPAALQYDEINRAIVPPATPPAPGTFQSDFQNVIAAGPSGASGGSNHGLGSMIGNMMGGANPEQMMQRISLGHLTRYTYYKGWLRTDDPVEQTAVIEKCQEHQYITLDLAKKTYAITTTQPPCPTTAGMPMRPGSGGSYRAEPGTADMNFTGTSNDLGSLAIDGVSTVGYDQNMQMNTTNATGSCRDGSFSMEQTKYISQIHVPRPYCPLPRTMSTGGMMTRASGGGCEPRMHASGSLTMMNDGDRLVMYLRMAMGGESAHGMNMVVERGNVKWFSGKDADALFEVPPGFTQSG